MVERRYFSHTDPEGRGLPDRLAAARISFRMAGENIAFGYADAGDVLDGWLNSPLHRANIENCAFTHQGLGRHRDVWTQVLLRPREPAPRVGWVTMPQRRRVVDVSW
jgi:uncharacterized protein YkwD